MREDAKNRLYEASARAEVTIFLDELGRHIDRPIIGRQLAFQNPVNLPDVLRDPGLEGLRVAPSERYPPKKVLQELLTTANRGGKQAATGYSELSLLLNAWRKKPTAENWNEVLFKAQAVAMWIEPQESEHRESVQKDNDAD